MESALVDLSSALFEPAPVVHNITDKIIHHNTPHIDEGVLMSPWSKHVTALSNKLRSMAVCLSAALAFPPPIYPEAATRFSGYISAGNSPRDDYPLLDPSIFIG